MIKFKVDSTGNLRRLYRPATWQNPAPVKGVSFALPSRTVPGQVLSMEELVSRYVRSDPNVTKFTPQYSDNDIPDIQYMDEMERATLAREMKQQNAADLAAMKSAEASRRRQKQIDDAVAESKAADVVDPVS